MRNSKKIVFLLIIFIAGVWFVVAQRDRRDEPNDLPDAAAELRRIVMAQQKTDSLLIDGDIRLYDEKQPGVLLEMLSFRSYSNGNTFYTGFGPLITLSDGHWLIQVDSLSERIVVKEMNSELQSAITSDEAGMQMLEKIWQDTSVFKVNMKVSEKNRQRVIDISSEQNPEIRSVSLTYDPSTARIQHAEIRWLKEDQTGDDKNNALLSKISYRSKPASVMDIGKIVKSIIDVKDGQITAAGGYAAYAVVIADGKANIEEK